MFFWERISQASRPCEPLSSFFQALSFWQLFTRPGEKVEIDKKPERPS
jgi:hypothetical protein